MRFQGSLQTWNADRGMGSIAPEQGGGVLYVHISAFPPDGPPPTEQERLSFEVVSGRDGCKQAVKVQRCAHRAGLAHKAWMPAPQRKATLRPQPRRRVAWALGLVLLLLLLLGVGAWAGQHSLGGDMRSQWAALMGSVAG